MAEDKEAFIGIDVAKLRNAVAIADAGRDGEVRFYGEVDASPDSMRRLAAKLAGKYQRLHFCYEAGPTGYGLHRLLTGLGHSCIVVAPSLIPRKPSDRVKTNRRDAVSLARLLRAGELTAVWVPDTAHEAMRDLVRARAAAARDVGTKKRQVSAFLLRHSRLFPRKKNWGARYRCWLQEQSFEHPADQIVLQKLLEDVRLGEERRGRIEQAIEEFLPSWGLAPIVEALQALRGIELVTAVTFVVEVGDIARFESPRRSWRISAWCPASVPPGRRCGAARSLRWATRACGTSSSRVLGPTGTHRGSGRRSWPSWSAFRLRSARLPGRLKAD